MKNVRIQGLVALATRVQQALAGPLSADQRDQLKAAAERGLRQVHGILIQNSLRLEQVPEPSQRAYRFLAGINWANLSTVATSATSPVRPGAVQLSGFASGLDQVLHLLSRSTTVEQADPVFAQITALHQLAEDLVREGNVQPEQLTPQSWAARGWLAYFAQRDNLEAYVRAVATALPILEQRDAARERPLDSLRLYFQPMRGIYRLRGSQLSLPTPAICLEAEAFSALADLVFLGDRRARQVVHEAMQSESYQAIQAELESLAGIRDESQGAVHDLGAACDRVNQRYFGDQLGRPKLTWSRTFTGRLFGYYDHLSDRLMVSRTLDAPEVPSFVVDFVVFHELLHKQHGVAWSAGRKLAHTPRFRHDEQRFERFAEAEAFLKRLAHRP